MAPPLSKTAPPNLKKIVVFLRRAEELDRDKSSPESRVVAYNCRQYAVLQGIPLAGTDASSKSCLGELLDQLEKEKSAMAVFSKGEHWKICRKVADRVFDKADGEDQAGLADKGTAKTFYAAGTFYEILQQFYDGKGGEVEDDEETAEQKQEEEHRRVYCKWKATEILNAIKEGREPTPGGYKEQRQIEDDALPLVCEVDTTNVLSPAPEMPSVDLFFSSTENESTTNDHSSQVYDTNDDIAPPLYDDIELNLNGEAEPTNNEMPPAVKEVNERVDDSDDIFIPGALESSDADMNNTNLQPLAPSPSYSQHTATKSTPQPSSPPPSAAIPTQATASPKASIGGGVLSSLFGKSHNTIKVSKEQMNDAVELTKFALAALQTGDGELGRQRLEEALGVLRR
jgi:vacuolar protein sorting-associated protein VTA1